jgi:hypothetical protein
MVSAQGLGLVLDRARERGRDKGKNVGEVGRGAGVLRGGWRRTVWTSTVRV